MYARRGFRGLNRSLARYPADNNRSTPWLPRPSHPVGDGTKPKTQLQNPRKTLIYTHRKDLGADRMPLVISPVVGHEQIWPTIAVVVAPHYSHSMEFLGIVDAGRPGDLLECSIPPISIKQISFSWHAERQFDQH